MKRVLLEELNMTSRQEAISFLKKLWKCESVSCPMCGSELELLHKKAKKVMLTGNVRNVIKHLRQYIY